MLELEPHDLLQLEPHHNRAQEHSVCSEAGDSVTRCRLLHLVLVHGLYVLLMLRPPHAAELIHKSHVRHHLLVRKPPAHFSEEPSKRWANRREGDAHEEKEGGVKRRTAQNVTKTLDDAPPSPRRGVCNVVQLIGPFVLSPAPLTEVSVVCMRPFRARSEV